MVALLLKNVTDASFSSFVGAVNLYLPLLQSADDDNNIKVEDVKSEFLCWKVQRQAVLVNDRPTNCVNALLSCNFAFFSTIHPLLRIFVFIPVSTASPERTFSAMKILKTYLYKVQIAKCSSLL